MNEPDFNDELSNHNTSVNADLISHRDEEDEANIASSRRSSWMYRLKHLCFKNIIWLRRVTVEPALLLVMISMGLTGSVSIQYVRHVIYKNHNITEGSGGPCSGQHNNTPTADQQAAQAELNAFSIFSGFAGGVPSLFVTLIVSAASDRIGRKIPLLLPVLGMLMGTCAFLVVALFELPLTVLLVSNVAVGFSGNFGLFFSGCSSYIADTTSKKDRTFVIALLYTISLVGSSIAIIGAGYWIQDGIYTDPFWLALALQMVVLVYVIFWLRESVPSAKSNEQGSGGPNSEERPSSKKLSGIWHGFLGIFKVAEEGRRIWLALALLVLFLSLVVFASTGGVLIIRLLGPPFCWDSVLLGFFNAAKPFINGLGLTLGAGLLTKCLNDYAVIQVGLLSTVGMLVLICICTETYGMFLVNLVGCFHVLPPAILGARMSKIIAPNLQGALFSLTGATENLATLFGPFLLGLIYQGTLNTFPLAVFIVMIGLTLITMLIVGILMAIESHTDMEYWKLEGGGDDEDGEA